jgi:hypothetical protein
MARVIIFVAQCGMAWAPSGFPEGEKPCHPSLRGEVYYTFSVTPIMFRMVGCDLSYGDKTGGNTTSVQNFLPLYRTIKIQPLTTNTSYWVHMVCRDKDGGWHALDTVNFTTGTQKT